MSDGQKRIRSPLTGCKKRKIWNKTREKYMLQERRQNLAETERGSYYKQEGWLEAFFDNKSAFSDGSESDDSDNDDENYNENTEAFVCRCSSKKVFLKLS